MGRERFKERSGDRIIGTSDHRSNPKRERSEARAMGLAPDDPMARSPNDTIFQLPLARSCHLGCRQSNFAAKFDVVATGSNENVEITRIGVPPLCGGVIVGKSPVIQRHSDMAILPGAATSFIPALKLLHRPRHLPRVA